MFQGWFLSPTPWLCLNWSLSCGLDLLPTVSEFLKRLFVHCPATQGHKPNTAFLQTSSDHLLQNRTSAMEPQRRVGFSSAGMNRVTRKCLGRLLVLIARQLLATAVVMHHLILGRSSRGTRGLGHWSLQVSLQRAALCAHSPAVTALLFLSCTPGVIHSRPDSPLTSP